MPCGRALPRHPRRNERASAPHTAICGAGRKSTAGISRCNANPSDCATTTPWTSSTGSLTRSTKRVRARRRSCRTSLLALQRPPLQILTLNEEVRHVVLIDVADIRHRLPADPFGGHPLDVVEPDVGIETAPRCLPPQLTDPSRAGIVGRE